MWTSSQWEGTGTWGWTLRTSGVGWGEPRSHRSHSVDTGQRAA